MEEELPNLIVSIDSEGTVHTIAVSLLEDLWHDYIYHKKKAMVATEAQRSLLAQRHVRAALLTLTCYLEGVGNRWYRVILTFEGVAKDEIAEGVRRTSLYAKLKDISEWASTDCDKIEPPDINDAKYLRNEIVHLKDEGDMDLFRQISIAALEQLEQAILPWFEQVEQSLGVPRHIGTANSPEFLASAFGEAKSDEYSGDGLFDDSDEE